MNHGSILVVNAGSSSLKFSIFREAASGPLQLVRRGQVDGVGARPRLRVKAADGAVLEERDYRADDVRDVKGAIGLARGWLRDHLHDQPLRAVGHRVVHGGPDLTRPVLVDAAVLSVLEGLIPLAPLHQPHNLAAIRAFGEAQPRLPQVACFDTAFHRGHSLLADLYAIPWEFHTAGVRRYGFHGLSYEYIAAKLPELAPELAGARVIVAHLGSGASLCALHEGRSVDSTMGFTPLDGVPMGTRPGALDPGVLLHLLQRCGMSADDLERLLYRQSGLLGLSGVSNDMRVLLESDAPRARLAVDYFVAQVVKQIGALAAVLGGLDALVFTAGIGEHSAEIRGRIMQGCSWLGVLADGEANRRGGPCISAGRSAVSVWVVPTDEELMIARHTLARLAGGG